MKKLFPSFLITIIFISFYINCKAQQCESYSYEDYLNSKFPGIKDAISLTRTQSNQGLYNLNKAELDTVYQIPVVFHIVWNNASQNLDDSLIHSQLKALNEAYRHLHQDTGKVRSVFKPVVGDTKIEFYLAYKTPEGKPTNGIDRVKTKRFDFGGTTGYADAVKYTSEKGIDAWDPDKYLNIWVCNFTYNGVMAVSAYAYPPINAQFWNASYYKSSDLQGVVINYPFIGVGNPNDLAASSLRERTLVHEIGHYLGLRHIWADKQNTCTGEDDGIKDTPVCRSATTTCNPLKNTCIESTGDKPDMLENYMDYTPYPCTVMFTKQQSSLMKYNLKNLRPILYNLKSDQPFPSVYAKIAVAPNPALNNIRFIFEQEGEYSLKIFNMLGQPLNEEIFKVGNNYEYTSNAQLSSGVYHIKILSSQKILLQQQIIVR